MSPNPERSAKEQRTVKQFLHSIFCPRIHSAIFFVNWSYHAIFRSCDVRKVSTYTNGKYNHYRAFNLKWNFTCHGITQEEMLLITLVSIFIFKGESLWQSTQSDYVLNRIKWEELKHKPHPPYNRTKVYGNNHYINELGTKIAKCLIIATRRQPWIYYNYDYLLPVFPHYVGSGKT